MRRPYVIQHKEDKDLYLAHSHEHGYTTARIQSEFVLRYVNKNRANKAMNGISYVHPWIKKFFHVIDRS